MAALRYDSRQAKQIAALLALLVLTVGFMGFRVSLRDSNPQVVQQQRPARQTALANEPPPVEYASGRNPFVKPPFLTSSNPSDSGRIEQTGRTALPAHARSSPWTAGGFVPPLEIRPTGKNTESGSGAANAQAKPCPSFTLLATVRGEKGLCAIIKTNDADVRVVGIGDTLADGFRVKALEDTRATITDGRNTIIARRPQS